MAFPAKQSEPADDNGIENYPINNNNNNNNNTAGNTTAAAGATAAAPTKYLPLDHVYSATSPCRPPASSHKKPLPRKFNRLLPPLRQRVPVVYVYIRRSKRPHEEPDRPSLFFTLLAREKSRLVKEEVVWDEGECNAGVPLESDKDGDSKTEVPKEKKFKKERKKRRKRGSGELAEEERARLVLGRLRERREVGSGNGYCETTKRRKRDHADAKKDSVDNMNGLPGRRRWVRFVLVSLVFYFPDMLVVHRQLK